MLLKAPYLQNPPITQPIQKYPNSINNNSLTPLSIVKSTRLALKYVRRFIAGFASIPAIAIGQAKEFPFTQDRFALEQDKYEVTSDRELATFKQKQNERK